MKFFYYSFMFLSSLPTLLPAQNHDAFGFFGYGVGLTPEFGGATIDYREDPPKIYREKKGINFTGFCASCSDSSGNLLFYSNGISVRNKLHQLMRGGDSLNNTSTIWEQWKEDGYPHPNGAFTLPDPRYPNRYWMFHTALEYKVPYPLQTPFMYTLIDMDSVHGLGSAITKNKRLFEGGVTDPVAVKHANGRDWWILTAEQSKNRHLIYRLSPSGLTLTTQTIGPPFDQFEGPNNSSISPDGRIYVRHDVASGLRIYDFDRCSGRLSNLRFIPFTEAFYVFSNVISPDSRFLYLDGFDALMSIDLWAPDPALTLDTIAVFDGYAHQLPFRTGFWTSQLRPNGKIHYATVNSTFSMHVLHRPEIPGQAADMEQRALALPVYNDGTICRFPNYRLGRWVGSPCDTLPPAAGPHAGEFVHHPYVPPAVPPDEEGYRVLSPLRGKGGAPQGRPRSINELALDRQRLKAKE